MKKTFIAFAFSILFSSLLFAQNTKKTAAKAAVVSKPVVVSPKKDATMQNSIDSVSYAIGVNIAENLRQQNLKVNSAIMTRAIDDILAQKPTLMTPDACNNYLQSYFQNEAAKKGVANKAIGEKFLAENKTKAGVVTLSSGLQYLVMKEGSGAKPSTSDKVKVHYHGTLVDGTVFDSSVERKQPAEFGVTQVIQGWVEALQLMPVGSKWKLFIPSDLAYGLQGPQNIGPNQVLIFEVELLDIIKQ